MRLEQKYQKAEKLNCKKSELTEFISTHCVDFKHYGF